MIIDQHKHLEPKIETLNKLKKPLGSILKDEHNVLTYHDYNK